jgi:hypothetical protein
MEEGRRPLWRHFIRTIPEADLSSSVVIDFGCDRGGFLRLLGSRSLRRRTARSYCRTAGLGSAISLSLELAAEFQVWGQPPGEEC